MLVTECERMRDEIRKLADKFGHSRYSLLPVLQAVQAKYSYIPDYAMQEIADLLKMHAVEVYSVISFYGFLSDVPNGKYVIRLCRTISCDMQGKEAVARMLENELGIKFGEVTPDGMFKLEYTNCLGMCDQGPALLINDKILTQVKPEQVSEIIQKCKKEFFVQLTEEKEGHH